jgi:hypothetical protein
MFYYMCVLMQLAIWAIPASLMLALLTVLVPDESASSRQHRHAREAAQTSARTPEQTDSAPHYADTHPPGPPLR